MTPNALEFAFMFGVPKLTWFGRLVNVLSKRSLNCSVMGNASCKTRTAGPLAQCS